MFDTEIIEMLALIHAENAMIFEMVRSTVPTDAKKITFDAYQEAYEEIIGKAQKYSACSTCGYKNREEKIKEILKKTKK